MKQRYILRYRSHATGLVVVLAEFVLMIFGGTVVPSFAAGKALDGMVSRRSVPNPLVEHERALMQGRADDAAAGLRVVLATNPKDGRAHLLLCRVFYSEELADAAVTECEAALETLGNNSTAQDWMGRVYGLKADQSGPIAGYKLANKVRIAFEAAVQLDPKNADAVDDLSEYYVGAPSMLGGGTDKAYELATKVEAQLPQPAHRIRGLAAEKERDYTKAELEFKAAVAMGGRADAWTDLGHFYARHSQKNQAIDALKHAIAVDRAHDESLVDIASILNKMHREPALGEQVLRDYLVSTSKSDAAPAFKAHVMLGKMLESNGDKPRAQTEFQSALELAKDYAPAKKALQHL
jgi:tetratricopeptide (TPR) repeat protein